MEKKLTPVSSASPSWRALLAAKKAKEAKAAKAEKAAKSEKAEKAAKAEKEAHQIKQGQVRKARQDFLTNKHNATAFRKAAAQERAEKADAEARKKLAKFQAEFSFALSQVTELGRALGMVPADGRNIRLFPVPGIILAWTTSDAASASAAAAPSKPSKPSAPSKPSSKKSLARKAQADARAKLGLGKARSIPRVRTASPSDATALSAAVSACATAATASASALKTEKDPTKRQELHRTYTKASVWAKDLYDQAEVAEGIGVVDGITPSELSVVPFSAKAKTAQRRRLLWVGLQIGRGLSVKRAEAREAFAKAVAKAEAEIAATEEVDEFGAWYLENQERAKQGLAPLAPEPVLTVGEAEDLDQRSAMSFEDLVAALKADLEEESYARYLGLRCGKFFLEGEVQDAVAAYGESQCSWEEALEAVLAKCYTPIQQDQEGGSNE